MKPRTFAIRNLLAFAGLLPLYLIFADRSPLILQLALIIGVGCTGWLGFSFLVLSLFRRL